MSFFTITPAQATFALDGRTRQGRLTFQVQNKSGHPRDLRALVLPGDGEHEPRYAVAEPITPARVDETVEFAVDVEAPAEVQPGAYRFRLRVVAEDDPDDVFNESDPVTVQVPEAVKPSTPWWIYAAGAGAVAAVAGVLAFLFFFSGGGGEGDAPQVLSIAPESGRTFTAETFRESAFVAPVSLAAVVEDESTAVADLVVEWSSDQAGPLGSELLLEPELAGACRGLDHHIQLTVTDADGNSTTEETTVTVTSALFAPGVICPLIFHPDLERFFAEPFSQEAVERLRSQHPDLFDVLSDQRLSGIVEAEIASGTAVDEALRAAYRTLPEAVAEQAELLDADLGASLRERIGEANFDAALAEMDDDIEAAGGVSSLDSR